MAFLVLTLILIFLFVFYKMKMFNGIVFNLVWFLTILVNYICIPLVFEPSLLSYFVVILFVLIVDIGMLLGNAIKVKKQTCSQIQRTFIEYLPRKHLFYWVNIIAIVLFFVFYTTTTISLIAQGNYFEIRYYAFNSSEEYFGSTLKLLIAQQGFFSLFLASSVIGVVELFNMNKINPLKCGPFLIGVIEILLYCFTFQGRNALVFLIFIIVVSFFLLLKNKEKRMRSGNNGQKNIVVLLLVLIAVAVFISILRFDGLADLKKYLAIYFGGQITYFSVLIDNYSPIYSPLTVVFSGLFDYFKLAANSFLSLNLNLGSNMIGTIIDGSTTIGNGLTMNAGCTSIFYFYYELGFFGIIFYGFIFGTLSSFVQKKYWYKKNNLLRCLYILTLYALFYSYSSWVLKYLYFWIVPLIIVFFYKKVSLEYGKI